MFFPAGVIILPLGITVFPLLRILQNNFPAGAPVSHTSCGILPLQVAKTANMINANDITFFMPICFCHCCFFPFDFLFFQK
jgi:hypothetical protein